MSDRIRLSLWFRATTRAQLLPRLAQAIEALPQEAQQRGVHQFSVVALAWNETALLDERAQPPIRPIAAMEAMREFAHADCACEVEMQWLLWEFTEGEWKQTPHTLRLTSLGPDFADGKREEGDVTVDFGLDEVFLAELAPWNRQTRQHMQANIVQLLVYCRKVQENLQPTQRRLWSESESDWTEKLNRRLRMASTDAGDGSEKLVQ